MKALKNPVIRGNAPDAAGLPATAILDELAVSSRAFLRIGDFHHLERERRYRSALCRLSGFRWRWWCGAMSREGRPLCARITSRRRRGQPMSRPLAADHLSVRRSKPRNRRMPEAWLCCIAADSHHGDVRFRKASFQVDSKNMAEMPQGMQAH